MINTIANVYLLKNSKAKQFDQALVDLGIDPETYVKDQNIEAKAGRNIIVISLESLEKGFLSPSMSHLTPNLNDLIKENTYYNMDQSSGSEWTEASIYTSLTGVPAFFRTPKNETFNNTKISNVGNLGTVLKTAGYDMTYFVAKKEFSGLNDLLEGVGFTVLSEDDLDVDKTGFWGLQDKDLFESATKTIIEKNKNDAPFAVFMNTISGHFPDGVYDKRLDGVLPAQRSELEFMTAAVDHFIGEMIKRLEAQGILDNTDIYIYPDHLFMGNLVNKLDGYPDDRGLYVITTAKQDNLKQLPNKLSQLHIPKLIIDGSQIETNATFLVDFIDYNNDMNAYVNYNIHNILSLNEPSMDNFNFAEGIKLSYNKSRSTVTVTQEDGYSKMINGISADKLYRIYFDENLRYLKCADVPKNEAFWRGDHIGIVFSVQDEEIFAHLLKGPYLGITKHEEEKIEFDKSDLELMDRWGLLRKKHIPKPDELYLKSTSWAYRGTSGPSQITTGLQEHIVKRGLNLLVFEANTFLVEHYDTFESKDALNRFVKRVEELRTNKRRFAIVSDDSVGDYIEDYEDELKAIGLLDLAELEGRAAYVAYINESNYIIEQFHDKSINETQHTYNFNKKYSVDVHNDRSRYIAHGGGIIENNLITNSVEALNLNYSKGFRYFEIDILKTSDNVYVGVHDWPRWQRETGYTGKMPPTHSDFMKLKIHGKYTPVDIKTINEWFSTHHDAILVTDKINEPTSFSNKFIDNSRLMMELFSLDAFSEGQQIKDLKGVLFTNELLYPYKGKELQKLKELNVKYLAVSRKFVEDNKSLFLQINKAGIKTYVYNVNFVKGKDEDYVFKYEIGLVYGMYADKWTFPDMEIEDKNEN